MSCKKRHVLIKLFYEQLAWAVITVIILPTPQDQTTLLPHHTIHLKDLFHTASDSRAQLSIMLLFVKGCQAQITLFLEKQIMLLRKILLYKSIWVDRSSQNHLVHLIQGHYFLPQRNSTLSGTFFATKVKTGTLVMCTVPEALWHLIRAGELNWSSC